MPLYEKPHKGHDKHLCNLVTRGISIEEFGKLVKEPNYLCKQCGRVAEKQENLCDPLRLRHTGGPHIPP